jgi:hypothetical protein
MKASQLFCPGRPNMEYAIFEEERRSFTTATADSTQILRCSQ